MFPRTAFAGIDKELTTRGMMSTPRDDIRIGYERPPRIVQKGGVSLFEVVRV